jgi:formylglycine-generating enzyme required for sulfatase activity
MIVIPRGEFVMGSPPNENGRVGHEGPQHKVQLAADFAVSKFEVTFDPVGSLHQLWRLRFTY